MAAQDTARLRELILYVAEQSECDPRFGKTKLFKILFYADFLCYRKTGRPLTGEQYLKGPLGPVPAGADSALQALVKEGSLALSRRGYHGQPQQRPLALRDPDLSAFTGPEIALVSDVIRELWDQNASEVSRISHDFIGWQAASMGEAIPYETMFVSDRPLTGAEYQRGAELEPAGAG